MSMDDSAWEEGAKCPSGRRLLLHQADVEDATTQIRLAFAVVDRFEKSPELQATISLVRSIIGNDRPMKKSSIEWVNERTRDEAIRALRMLTEDLIAAPYIGAEYKAALEAMQPYIQ